MAKSKFPKKSNGAREELSTPLSENSNGAGEATSGVALAESPGADKNTRRTTRKPEIVKSDARANLLPINVEEEIRRLAYLLSERRGFEPGHEAEDWFTAEREIRQRYRQHSA